MIEYSIQPCEHEVTLDDLNIDESGTPMICEKCKEPVELAAVKDVERFQAAERLLHDMAAHKTRLEVQVDALCTERREAWAALRDLPIGDMKLKDGIEKALREVPPKEAAADLEDLSISELCELIETARTIAKAKQAKMQAACYCHRSPPCHYCVEGGHDDIP